MRRTRLNTTVDADLLEGARRVRPGVTDAALIDEALTALLARHRAEVDASYAAYDKDPLDEPDEWGDLASFRQAVGHPDAGRRPKAPSQRASRASPTPGSRSSATPCAPPPAADHATKRTPS